MTEPMYKPTLKYMAIASMLINTIAASAESPEKEIQVDVNGYVLSGVYQAATKNQDSIKKAILIIAGSGATDRNGNNEGMGLINNSYKMLADALNQAGFAVLRTDKRGVGKSASPDFDMSQTVFKDYVNDVSIWIDLLQQSHDEITVIGHSLGGLMMMQAAQSSEVDHVIALASVADSGYATIKRQMGDQPEFVSQAAIPLLDRLAKQESIPAEEVPPFLNALFSPKIQKYMQSFMLLEPKAELAKLAIPALVIIGDTDIQITVKESEQMAANLSHVSFEVIKGMNHVLKPAPEERQANLATYSQAELPLHPDLVPTILEFLKNSPYKP